MDIIKINNQNRYFDEIINIYYKWWGLKKDLSKEDIKKIYLNTLDNNKLPNIYALICNDTLLGIYELNEKDNVNEYSYTPYLANVYIKPEYRNRNLSPLLINDSKKQAKALGYDTLYLHTKHENYYEKYGFKYIKELDTKYGKKRLFKIEL